MPFFALFMTPMVGLLISVAVAVAGPADSGYLHFTDTTLSARLDRVPIQDVLRRIAAYGVTVTAAPSLSHTVTARITQAPVADGLRQLFSPLSYSLVWESVETPAGALSKVSEIHVFRPGERAGGAPISRQTVFEVAIDPVTGRLVLPGELLVQIGPGTDLEALKALLERFEAVIVAYLPKAGVLRLRLPAATALADALAAIGVAAEPHVAYRLPPLQADRAGVPAGPRAPAAPAGSGGASIAILDSGLKAGALPDHLTVAAFNAIDPGADIDDRMGHGTQMALIAAGRVTPMGADGSAALIPVIPVKIFDENGVTSNFTVLRAVTHAMENGARVISLSWGSETDSGFLEALLAHAGVAVVAASGNAPTGKPIYPAAYASVVGVGALAPDGSVWSQSNRGGFVSVYAAGIARFDASADEPAGAVAGTSVATAYTANRMAAFFAENPGADTAAFLSSVTAAGAARP